MITFTTAGESHGKALVAIVEGVPSGLTIDADFVNEQLKRRMLGYGRGARMKIESDAVEFLSGVRAGETIGSPIAMLIANRDWDNWSDVMDPAATVDDVEGRKRRRALLRPRPGHADLVGTLKYGRNDARDILERASARETAARTAAGTVCRRLIGEFGIAVGSHVITIGGVSAVSAVSPSTLPTDINAIADESPVRCLDKDAGERMITAIDAAKKEGDTLGGVVEVVAAGVPVGLGSHVSWERKLDGRIARAMMSIPAVKSVEIGLGRLGAGMRGSEVHDAIFRGESRLTGGFPRRSNNAGGMEGGITTGEPLVVRVAMKPISTLMKPLESVDLETGESAQAQSERSDVVAVPAMGVIAEAMLCYELANALVEKFGGDSVSDMYSSLNAYLDRVARD